MDEFALWRSSFLALHQCIVSLVTILGFCLQLEFSNASALVTSDGRKSILMKLFIIDISLYFGILGFMMLQINQNTRDFGDFMNKISVLLGTLACILELLNLFPAFGWVMLSFWIVNVIVTAIGSFQVCKTMWKVGVEGLVLALDKFQVKLISVNARLMGSVVGIGRGYENLKDLIKRRLYSTENDDETKNLSKELPV